MKSRRWLNLLLVLSLTLPFPLGVARAQQGNDDPPVYIVQAGDTAAKIATRFRVSSQDLIQVNQIANPNNLTPGDRLVLPGFPGIHGVLTTRQVAYGETLRSISRRTQISLDTLLALNPITAPVNLYAGATIILPQTEPSTSPIASDTLANGEPLLAMAMVAGINPWLAADLDGLASPQSAIPGDLLVIPPSADSQSATSPLPWVDLIELNPLPFMQGDTIELRVKPSHPLQLGGRWMGHDLHFFPDADGSQVALAGVYALTDPGLYPLILDIQDESGTAYQLTQAVQVISGNYPQDPHLTVDPQTIDPKFTQPENDQVAEIVRPATPQKYWEGPMLSPGYNPKWINSGYGDRRYYNDDPHVYFHTGVDYSGGVGLPIKAAAAGVVVFTGLLTVRGNVTYIDHGWGIYTAYFHQSRIDVKVGDRVQPGQVIGLIGATGRVTGAHLHWEVWADGVQVNPLDWLARTYP